MSQATLFEVRAFTSTSGHKLSSMQPVDSNGIPCGPASFAAVGNLEYVLGKGMPTQNFSFSFSVEGATVGEAFLNFPRAFAVAKAEAEQQLQQQVDRLIQHAGASRPLYGPRGERIR